MIRLTDDGVVLELTNPKCQPDYCHSNLHILVDELEAIRMSKVVIATRESALALWQANRIKDLLLKAEPKLQVDILGMTTEGDQRLEASLAESSGKGLFVKELEQAMLDGRADIAVHSMKDVPVDLLQDFCISAILDREDVRDAFISSKYQNLNEVPKGGVIGTSSVRRESQIRNQFSGLNVRPLRGNVQTRLRKLDEGRFDGIILAAAGLERLGLRERIVQYLPVDVSIPSAGQGALGVECLEQRQDMRDLLSRLDHEPTRVCVEAERFISRSLGGSCRTPLGAYARFSRSDLEMSAFVAAPDGSKCLRVEGRDEKNKDGAMRLSQKLVNELISLGARGLLDGIE
ncbi:MAG: hydroxymethylbilane synthase [Proteobacteria bacterium]|nr:hydroxymethylbilane synthase [Pseudomonadota bacterium]